MRTSVTLDDEIYEMASVYAAARNITLGAALGELVRKSAPVLFGAPESNIRMSPNGIPILSSRGGPINLEIVKAHQEDELG